VQGEKDIRFLGPDHVSESRRIDQLVLPTFDIDLEEQVISTFVDIPTRQKGIDG
jgi:hypothetical protein